MDPGPPVVVAGFGAAVGREVDPRPWLAVRKNRKFMGRQDDLAVTAAGRALESAGLAGRPLGERTGLYLVVGFIPFEEADIDALLAPSLEGGELSMAAFSTLGLDAVNPLLTFRTLPNMPAFHVSVNFEIQGPYWVGYPGVGQFYLALEEAVAALMADQIDLALVGGVADQANFLVRHHHRRAAWPVDPDRLESAAGFLVLSRGAEARATFRARTEYAPFDPTTDPPRHEESFSRGPDRLLGAASLAVALAEHGPGRLVHRAKTADGLVAESEWEILA